MADSKISALPASTTPLAGTEVLPIVQSSTTKQVSVANLTTGRAISATQLTLTTGNLIVANGQGIDFSATPGTGTSELFADYEEGSWTPVYVSTGATFTYTVQAGWYRKVGTLVTVGFALQASASGTITNSLFISGLPFTSQNTANTYGSVATGYTTFTEAATGQVGANDTIISAYRNNNSGNSATPTTTGIGLGSKYWIGTMSYQSA